MTAYFPAPVCEGTVHVPFFAVIGKRLAMSNARCSRVVIMPKAYLSVHVYCKAFLARSCIIGSMKKKNPAAVALGKLGGMKGGKARAAALTPEERSEI